MRQVDRKYLLFTVDIDLTAYREHGKSSGPNAAVLAPIIIVSSVFAVSAAICVGCHFVRRAKRRRQPAREETLEAALENASRNTPQVKAESAKKTRSTQDQRIIECYLCQTKVPHKYFKDHRLSCVSTNWERLERMKLSSKQKCPKCKMNLRLFDTRCEELFSCKESGCNVVGKIRNDGSNRYGFIFCLETVENALLD